jgi:membrane-associated protein
MGQLIEALLSSSGWAALAVLFLLPALEAPAFLGLVLPGELALLLGGVLASQGRIPLGAALAVGVAGALAGDSAGYWIGRRWGPRLLSSGLGRRVGPARLHRVEALLLGGGGWALVVARCTAGARVLLPGLAGMLGLRYRRFVLWTGAAAIAWAAVHVLLGYLAGAGWRQVHQLTGRVGLGLALAVLVALAVAWLLHRPARRHEDEPRQPVASGWRRVEAAGRTTQRRPSRSGSGGDGRPRPATIEDRREHDGARDCGCPGHATRRELTSGLGVRLAADVELSPAGRRRQWPRFVPSWCPAPTT